MRFPYPLNLLQILRIFFRSLLALAAYATCSSVLIAQEGGKPIPLDQLGAEAQKQYAGDGISITPTAAGAKLRAVIQVWWLIRDTNHLLT
jgi:hypothetical protein